MWYIWFWLSMLFESDHHDVWTMVDGLQQCMNLFNCSLHYNPWFDIRMSNEMSLQWPNIGSSYATHSGTACSICIHNLKTWHFAEPAGVDKEYFSGWKSNRYNWNLGRVCMCRMCDFVINIQHGFKFCSRFFFLCRPMPYKTFQYYRNQLYATLAWLQ